MLSIQAIQEVNQKYNILFSSMSLLLELPELKWN
jgi:hypothetical protein